MVVGPSNPTHKMDSRTLTNVQVDELLKQYSCSANHVHSFITPMSLRCAVQMGIADAIHAHGKPMAIDDLAASIGVRPQKAQFLSQLMRILAHLGYFSYQTIDGTHSAKGYGITLGSQLLLKDHPFSVKPNLLFVLSPININSWLNLSEWFRSEGNETPSKASNAMSFYQNANHTSEFKENVNNSMARDSSLVCTALIKIQHGYFEGLSSLVDVGGGVGGMARAIAKAYPHIQCTILDLPHVVEGLEGTHNLKFVGGDMFKEVPPANAILLKWILHNWDDKDCVKILKQCRKAICNDPRGKLIIVDIVVGDDDDPATAEEDHKTRETQLFFDMQMMVLLAGKERTNREWEKLFKDAGYSGGYKVFPAFDWRSVIEVYP